MIYDREGQKLGAVRQSASGRWYIRFLDGTCTPARWLTEAEAIDVLTKSERV